MDAEQIKYARSMFDAIITAKKDISAFDSITVDLATEVAGLDIYYSFDNSNRTISIQIHLDPVHPQRGVLAQSHTYRNGRPIGREIDVPIADLQRRVGLTGIHQTGRLA